MIPFSAAVLAGGRSTRMGEDKAFLVVDGQPLWQRQVAKLTALEPAETVLSLHAEQKIESAPVPIVRDAHPGIGPLGGILACLEAVKTSPLLVLGVDLPGMTEHVLRTLLLNMKTGCGAVFSRRGTFEPLCAIYPKLMLELGREMLLQNEYALQVFIRRGLQRGWMKQVEIGDSLQAAFANLNTPEDLARFTA